MPIILCYSRHTSSSSGTHEMILDRFYTPAHDELIYHYCPAAAFLEIVRSRTMWLSASYALNDRMERDWGYSIFVKALDQFQSEVGKHFIDNVRDAVDMAYFHSMLMISCYSLDGDMLSQWRAYADDSRGFSIGFAASVMQQSAKPLRVRYDEQAQLGELLGNLKHTYEYEKSIGFKFDDEFRTHWFHVGLDLCAYKHFSFAEEKEIRLAHVSGLISDENSRRILALGARGQDGKLLSEPSDVHFRIRNGIVVPYIVLDYSNRGTISPIKEIILGARNENTESHIEVFLNTIGVTGVPVRRSNAPYR
jgi:hypothetical protein